MTPISRRHGRSPSRAVCEPLERRRLLAAGAFSSLSRGGTLTVVGGRFDDVIDVRRVDGPAGPVVRATRATRGIVEADEYPAAAVRRVWVSGFDGNDVIAPQLPVAVTLFGGHGNDVITSPPGTRAGAILYGGPDDDLVTGGGGADVLYGNSGNDSLAGGAGADTLSGGAGADELRGGSGSDFVTYIDSPAGVTLRASADGSALSGTEGEGDRIIADVENFVGSQFDDVITGTDSPNRIYGYGGNDLLTASRYFLTGNTLGDTLYGLDGNDTLLDSTGDDFLYGGAGNDLIEQRRSESFGTDLRDGGPGNDTLSGGPGPDNFIGGPGVDTVSYAHRTSQVSNESTARGPDPHNIFLNDLPDDGAVVRDVAEGDNVHSDVENVIGSAGDDTIVGTDEPNFLDGGLGSDKIVGLGGNDTLIGDWAFDVLFGGPGDDTFDGPPDDGRPGGTTGGIVDYSDRTNPVTVDTDARTGGEAGERDVILNFSGIRGGAGDDTLLVGPGGGAGSNIDSGTQVFGGPGNDVIRLLPAVAPRFEQMRRVDGGAGDDLIDGSRSGYRLLLIGGPGRDTLLGSRYIDEFFARDGEADRLVGGGTDGEFGSSPGPDNANVDQDLDDVQGIGRITTNDN